MTGDIHIREETEADTAAIDAVTIAAFLDAPHALHNEQFIVRALRRSGMLTVSLVAETLADSATTGIVRALLVEPKPAPTVSGNFANTLVGHVAISPVGVSDGTVGWYGLGPVSVLPGVQHRGVGAALVRQALGMLRRLDSARGCVVLGDPAYYGRFGFAMDTRSKMPDAPPEYFQVLSFDGTVPTGVVRYHSAFAATS